MNKLYIFLLFIIFSFNSCDILRTSEFEVVSWSPGEGYHPEPEKIIVSLSFSHNPDRSSIERRFSLTGDGGRIKGVFIWENKKVTFSPLTPLEKNSNFTLSLSVDANDTDGLSMDIAFERNFTTRAGSERPVLVSHYPLNYETISDPRSEIRLQFSIPIPLNTLYDNVYFNPSMIGLWSLENSGKLAIFTPSEPWSLNKRYEIRISTSLTDNNEMNIRNDFTSVFTVGMDNEAPTLLNANRITKNNEIFSLELDTSGYIGAVELLTETQGWEKDDRLSLVFSEPVDALSVKNCLNVENASGHVMETTVGYQTEFIFYFETIPTYENRFVFRLKPGVKDKAGNETKNEYIYRIFANGEFSKPPALVGIRIPMAPENQTDPELACFEADSLFEIIPITDENYPSDKKTETWIELYFETAEGASIDPFSLMELFRIETSNNVLTFSPRRIKTNNFSIPEKQTGWEEYDRLEIAGTLTNSIYFGVVNFQIAAGLKDNLGNKNEKMLSISLIK